MQGNIRCGDKLYIITREDLDPGYQAVQSGHALIKFAHDYPELESEWFNNSNYLAYLSVKDELELIELLNSADNLRIPASFFQEPDIGNKITAIALAPGIKTRKLCARLKLALT